VRAGELLPKATQVLDAILYRGEIERGQLPELLGGVTPRHARRVSSSLLCKERYLYCSGTSITSTACFSCRFGWALDAKAISRLIIGADLRETVEISLD